MPNAGIYAFRYTNTRKTRESIYRNPSEISFIEILILKLTVSVEVGGRGWKSVRYKRRNFCCKSLLCSYKIGFPFEAAICIIYVRWKYEGASIDSIPSFKSTKKVYQTYEFLNLYFFQFPTKNYHYRKNRQLKTDCFILSSEIQKSNIRHSSNFVERWIHG